MGFVHYWLVTGDLGGTSSGISRMKQVGMGNKRLYTRHAKDRREGSLDRRGENKHKIRGLNGMWLLGNFSPSTQYLFASTDIVERI